MWKDKGQLKGEQRHVPEDSRDGARSLQVGRRRRPEVSPPPSHINVAGLELTAEELAMNNSMLTCADTTAQFAVNLSRTRSVGQHASASMLSGATDTTRKSNRNRPPNMSRRSLTGLFPLLGSFA